MYLSHKLLVLFFVLAFTGIASAQKDTYFCQKFLEDIPIQQGGRVKPLYVHSKEIYFFMTGQKKPKELTHTQVYCLLSLKAAQINVDLKINTKIEHVELKKFLELKDGTHTIDIEELVAQKDEIRLEAFKQKENNSYKKALTKTMNKIGIYEEIINGANWLLPEVNGKEVAWIPIVDFLSKQKQAQDEAGVFRQFKDVFVEAKNNYIRAKGDNYLLELTYVKSNIFHWSMLFALLGICAITLFKKMWVTWSFVAITILAQIIGITMRVMISGRAPITNMYETVMFSGFGALIIGLIISYTRKDKQFVLVGLSYNILTLFMMAFANNMLDPSISPLVPVLRDNFWLSTHVTTIILSYAALALSWVMANIMMVKKWLGKISKEEYNYNSDLIYTSLKYGSIMLSAGIILGGVWADYSWGRFWGWDPKETWSLVVLCIYMAILHGRYTNWIPNVRFVPIVALAFLSVMMAWFGVNYILASGLHSYGFSEGGAIFLGTFFAVQIAILVVTQVTGKNSFSDTKPA